jgi:hypothetical protein
MYEFLSKYLSLLAEKFAWPLFIGGLLTICAGKLGILRSQWLNENADWLVVLTIFAGSFSGVDLCNSIWCRFGRRLSGFLRDRWIRIRFRFLSEEERALIFWCVASSEYLFYARPLYPPVTSLCNKGWITASGRGTVDYSLFRFEFSIWNCLLKNRSMFEPIAQENSGLTKRVAVELERVQRFASHHRSGMI